MGEYADDYFRQEVKAKFGFDPGSMYSDRPAQKAPKARHHACRLCTKRFVNQQAVDAHLKDKHGVQK